MISQAGWWTRTPFTNALQPIKWNATFWITFNFWWLAGLVNGLKPYPPFLCSQRNEMLIFVLCSTSNDQPGLSMDLNRIHHLSPAKKWNAHISIMFNFWWSARLVNGLEPHPPSLSSQKKMKCLFLDYVHFWWSAWLIDEFEPHLPPLSSQKKKSSFLDFVQLLMISQAGKWTQTPSTTPLQPKTWNAHFCITFNFWCWPGWSMDWNPIHHPSPPQKMKCSFLDYVQLLMIGRAGQWTRAPSTTPLQPKKWNAHFCITFNIWCWPDWSMDLNLIHHSTPAKNKKCSFLGHIQLLMISQAVRWTQTPSASPLQPIKWNAHFWITFTSDDLPGWLMNLNLICHPSHTKKMKCSIFDYIQLLMISQTGQLT